MKLSIVLLIIVVTLSPQFLKAGDQYFYTEEGTMVQLVVQDSLVTVLLSERGRSWESIWEYEPGLNSAIDPEPIAEGFYKLRLRSGYSVDSVVSHLRELQEIQITNYCYLDPNGSPI